MRATSTASVAIFGATLLLVGCSSQNSLTSPTSVSSNGASPFAASIGDQHPVPFKGSFDGSDAVTFPPPVITTTATGTGTLVGRLSLTDVLTLNSNTGGTGVGHWVAANGDSIDTTFVASAVPGAVVFAVTEDHSVTGGTGRFSGAQGTFTVHRTHVVADSDDGTHVTSGSFEGTITLP